MADYDQDTREQQRHAFDALEAHAAELKRRGRHEDVRPSKLTAEIRLLADERIADAISNDQHEGRWIADPEVDNVWGWQPSDYTGRRVGLVYYRADADFECDGDWEMNLLTYKPAG